MVNYSKWTLISIVLSLTVFSSCDSTKSQTDKGKQTLEGFDQFYDKFHKDSVFQISRLRFPLQGHDEFGKEWTKANWDLMRAKIYEVDTSQFKVDFKKTDRTFFEKVWIDNSGFVSECRFELIDDKWYLVYALEGNN